MDRLYSPWRYGYVAGTSEPAAGCVFCQAQSDQAADPLLVTRTPLAFVILNLYPYNSGHLMVVPSRHVASLAELDAGELAELIRLTQRAEIALTEVYRPQGINVGLNLGRAAGAGIADHLHIHLLPRWTGDTNFMTTVGESRVIPEALEVTYEKLCSKF